MSVWLYICCWWHFDWLWKNDACSNHFSERDAAESAVDLWVSFYVRSFCDKRKFAVPKMAPIIGWFGELDISDNSRMIQCTTKWLRKQNFDFSELRKDRVDSWWIPRKKNTQYYIIVIEHDRNTNNSLQVAYLQIIHYNNEQPRQTLFQEGPIHPTRQLSQPSWSC
jgi:hypothetical protein